MFFPLVAAVGNLSQNFNNNKLINNFFCLAIGALAIGFFYRNREQDYDHDHEEPRSNFRPQEGYDTSPGDFTFPRRLLDDDEENKCRICLDIMQAPYKVRTLICAHRFHLKCIDEWLRHDNTPSCPLCRTRIL